MPIPKRKKAISKSRKFIFFLLARMQNVIISIKYDRIKVEDLVLKHVDDL